ncbi:5556_t:CDS:1, partial [Ambispora gerdemannii]
LDPCLLCNQELFLYEIKNPITILVCGHIYHRDCIEKSIKTRSICPRPDCKKEVEAKPRDYVSSTVDGTPGSQNTSDLMDVSLTLFSDSLLFPSPSKKRVGEPTGKLYSKKLKKPVSKENSSTLQRLIKELGINVPVKILPTKPTSKSNENPIDFLALYQNIINIEEISKQTIQEVILHYFYFGKALEERSNHYKKNNPKRTAQGLVNNEVRIQLPSVSPSLLRKMKERAQKIYDLFNEIGVDKIKRIQSFTAVTLSSISQNDIDYVLVQLSLS